MSEGLQMSCHIAKVNRNEGLPLQENGKEKKPLDLLGMPSL